MGQGDLARWGVVYVLALVASLRAGVCWYLWQAQLLPDTALYAVGGWGLFPSPLGRLVGMGGLPTIAALNIAASGALVLIVAMLAASFGGRPIVAALLALLTPLSLWTIFAGFDSAGAALVLGASLLWQRGNRRSAAALAFVAVGLHLSLLPLVAAAAVFSGPRWRTLAWSLGGLLAFGLVVAALTPYRGVVMVLLVPDRVFLAAIFTLGICALTFLPFGRRMLNGGKRAHRLLFVLVIGTGGAAALQSAGTLTNARYALPLAMFLCAAVASPWRGWRMTAGQGWKHDDDQEGDTDGITTARNRELRRDENRPALDPRPLAGLSP